LDYPGSCNNGKDDIRRVESLKRRDNINRPNNQLAGRIAIAAIAAFALTMLGIPAVFIAHLGTVGAFFAVTAISIAALRIFAVTAISFAALGILT